ncbi:class I SAM-dependent methyltransferase [Mucilaginibacter sp. RS28]|uniref:Class I SAM-dependent methyltransferase n=1 Tax=Mucilaginibacter straminoryzae TaxID=2932774 RepID=A0A9X2B927_9SPHI|nr:class I SAM-dependent methyltransferase [Mucilaginibacter straminoryzae]MCJ8210046.1 class I SAM-dependent methyltransferase [Mucilaginibacter straminoryzae]
METPRDFSTISPSAKSLLFLKGHTQIPYALQAAKLMAAPENFEPDFAKKDTLFWSRVYHFESRYRSIDYLLEGIDAQNILELSSGFSFRGLEAVKTPGVNYIDTDLPNVIEHKKHLILQLETFISDRLQLLPLNALNREEFAAAVNQFPMGKLTIVNEGLLMYLNMEEKRTLCRNIRAALEERGGYWITADAYVKTPEFNAAISKSDKLNQFFEKHNIEENKFDSFEQAEAFFLESGLAIDKEAEVAPGQISSLPYLLACLDPEQLAKLRQVPKMQKTWRLKLA